MSPQELDTLRKDVKKRMVDLDLDREGSYDILLPHLNDSVDFSISKSHLSMALTGYREGDKYQRILAALQKLLRKWPLGLHGNAASSVM